MTISEINLEEAIAWNAMRAIRKALAAVENGTVPPVLHAGETAVHVEIRLLTPEFPGYHASGRRKSTLIGDAVCVYRHGGITEHGK